MVNGTGCFRILAVQRLVALHLHGALAIDPRLVGHLIDAHFRAEDEDFIHF